MSLNLDTLIGFKWLSFNKSEILSSVTHKMEINRGWKNSVKLSIKR